MIRKSLLLGLLSLLAALPALAGTVYVPVASNITVGGQTYTTRVWLSNPGTASRRFTLLFLSAGSDGTSRTGVTPQSFTLAAGGTLLLGNLAPAGSRGLLEVTGAPQILVTARLDAVDPLRGVTTSAHVPAISSANLIRAGQTADLQGLERSETGPRTNLGVVNLGHRATQCTIRASRLNGAALGDPATVTLQPLSLRRFEDALAALGAGAVADARVAVSCADPFWTFAEILSPAVPSAVLVTPAVSLDSTLAPPGSGPAPNPGSAVVVERPGTFFIPVPGASALDVPIPLASGQAYRRATIEFDLQTNTFAPVFDSIVGLLRPGATIADRTLYFGFHIRGRRNRTFIDLGVPVLEPAIRGDFPWREQTLYRIRIVYDVQVRTITLQALQNGQVVHTVTGGIFNLDLSDNGAGMVLKFGLPAIADNAYFPPFNWTFSNLRAQIEP